jgi:DNA repair protein RecN (Recombination protein N)
MLQKTIEKELNELGFKSIAFEARFEKKPLSLTGVDDIAFYISTNAGESLKPLAQIVSSGEAARIMLAIKRALMKVDPVPVLIFDEIDAQIGGRLGTVIGTKLKEVAGHRQVILITHLPQIAAFAQTHFRINKVVDKGRTKTQIAVIDGKDKVNELAHMMAGDKMTDAAVKHAKEMLKEAGS